jgi:integrase
MIDADNADCCPIEARRTDMQRKSLTDELVTALPAKRKRYVVYDSVVRSLGVRVSPKGKKTWIVVGRFNGNKHPTRRKLAGKLTIEQARERAIKFDAAPSDKFTTVAEAYFKHIAKQRRAGEVERTIRRELFPRWQNKQIGTITRRDMTDAINAVKERGKPSAAHHLFAYAQGLFSYATANNLLEHSPCTGIKPRVLIGAKTPRQRVLSDDELRAVWHAAKRAGEFGQLVRLLMITGQRRSDVAEAPWSEFDTTAKLWTISPQRFKSNVSHVVPLSQLAMDVIDALDDSGERLFHVTGFSKSKRRLDKLMLVELRKRNAKAELQHWTLHDLRRTLRTRLSEKALGVTYEVREAVIGHSKRGLDRVYDQYDFLEEKREALDAWSERLSGIVSDSQRKSP